MYKKNNVKTGKKTLQVPLEIKADDVAEDGSFKGYGSTFRKTPDSGGDIIVQGAFTGTIERGGRNGNGIAMLYQHRAGEPIGVWNHIEENKKGLYMEGQLTLGVQRADETHKLMLAGALKGLSIGYDFPRDPETGDVKEGAYEIVREPNKRSIWYLKELELWEVSPVTFPMDIDANILTVKDFKGCKNERELEFTLRESGLSKTVAQYVVSLCKHTLRDSKLDDEEVIKNETEADLILKELQKRNRIRNDF